MVSVDGDRNLYRDGICPDKIHRVGNVMIDSLARLLPMAMQSETHAFPSRYAVATLHRPYLDEIVGRSDCLPNPLPAQTEQGCQAASQKQQARWFGEA